METASAVKTLFSKLICSKTGDPYDKNVIQTCSAVNKPLLAEYDLTKGLSREVLRRRPFNMWRYREVLPVEDDEHIVTLGEGWTPIWPLGALGGHYGLAHLFLKDESPNPTGSFKARGLAMAISKARELGVRKCVIPTAGNAGGAMSAYCARAGLEAHIYMPKATPAVFRKECELYGARVVLVEGSISDCAQRIAREREDDWFDVSTLKEPYRLEGKKTMGYEIAEQFNWKLPDVIIYPTGGGTGLIGIWKAFQEMEKLGWIAAGRRPRMVAVQTSACAPIVNAFRDGAATARPVLNPGATIANGLRVPAAFGDELILQSLYGSHGAALTVTDDEIMDGLHELARTEGRLVAPEGAAVWMACRQLLNQGWIHPEEQVVLLNTGSLYKYMENI